MRQAQQHRHFGLDEAGCSTVEMQSRRHGIQLRCDRQIQTSPSESPAVWPPPSVHGSPQHRRRFFGDTGESGVTRCECSSGSGRMREPTRRELYQWWSTSEPGGRLFRAKYVYRPLRDSPNDNPETELSLTPGDYLLIFGDMDEDFYYRGELWTGERGLVPSNYVEAVSEGVLGLDSSMNVDSLPLLTMAQDRSIAPAPANRLLARAASERATSGGVGTSAFASTNPVAPLRSAKSVDAFTGTSIAQIPHEQQAAAAMCSFSSLARNELLTQSDASICPFPVVDVSNVQVQEIRPFDGARVPCPRDLVVERQLTKSVLISWSPPVNALCPVAQYHVCVDGEVRAVVPAGYKTKALIEDVDSRKVHRISVRAVSDAGRSPDETCTVTLGQGSLIRPQELKVVNVTPVSCEVSWYPSYSSCEHLVLLNGLKVGSCPSGVYRVQIRGLIPSTMYRCAIRVKDPKAVLEEKPVESYVDFKTLPKIGLPDPPSEVHCEPGPQDGTLLITWRPVTTQPKPPSRAAVAGYLVYADGRKVCEVDSPSGDHAVLRLQDLNDDPPLFITVKTKTREGAVSSDSNVVRVPRSTSSTITDAMQPVGTSQTAPTQVSDNATTQAFLHISTGPQQGIQAATAVTSATTATPSPLVQITGVTATTATATATEKTSTTPSYYVFHPRLASQGADTDTTTGLAAAGGGGVSDLLTLSTQQEKPSLLEMETDYLSRHQQLQDRAAAYHAGASRPAVSARLQQAPTTLMTARQSAFSRRSYSLDEAPQDDYDPFGPAVLHPSGVGAATPAASTFHPVKHLRSAATAVTAFNGPHQRAGPSLLVGEALWTDSSPFRPSAAAALQMRTTIPRSRGINAPAFWPRQSDRPVAYGDFDAEPVDVLYDTRSKTGMTTATAAVPLLAENRAKMLAQGGALTSRHRRRLQDAAEARALSEPDLLHHDVNNRYLLQMPPVRHHVRRHHRSKTPTRLVVALYDYSPRHMSPNPNGHLDELSFRKGQLISILGDKDADGFYQGELDGRVGLVPSNLVVEVEGGVQALINSPPTSTGLVDYETLAGYPTGNGRYRDNRRAAARDQYYGGGYEEGGVWDGRNGGSDPMLSRRHPTALREQAHLLPEGPASSSFDNAYDRYPDMQDRYGTSASTARHRRNKYKQKSHSLEYDLDRRDYYDQEEYPYDQSGFRPVQHGRGRVAEYDPSYRLAARSLDQFHYTRQQPVPMGGAGDPYDVGGVPPDERAMGRHGGQRTAGQTGGRQAWPLPQQPYRESGVSDQDSEAELLYYQRQQQRKPMGPPRRMSMFEQRQQQQMGGPAAYTEQERGWRPDERGPPPAQFATSRQRPAAAYDRSGVPVDENLRRGSRAYVGEEQLLAEARKQQPAGDFYDSPTDVQDQVSSGVRRRGSLRRSGRQQLEQNIREAVACGAARRMVAKFDYDPKILSPNPGAECEELTFRAGDTILVFGDVDEDGFYIGELGGRRGLVPSNYLVREQDAGLATMANSIQPTQPGGLPQQPMYDAQAAGTMSTGRTKKESLVSFAPAAAESSTPISAQASPSSMAERKVASGQSGRPGPVLTSGAKTSSSGGTGTKRQPGQLKKADSTVGQKVPQKKVSVAGAAPGRKTSAAVSGKSGTGGAGKSSGGQEDGGIGKVWRKIVE